MPKPTIHILWEDDWSVDHLKEYDCYDEEPDSCEMVGMSY